MSLDNTYIIFIISFALGIISTMFLVTMINYSMKIRYDEPRKNIVFISLDFIVLLAIVIYNIVTSFVIMDLLLMTSIFTLFDLFNFIYYYIKKRNDKHETKTQ